MAIIVRVSSGSGVLRINLLAMYCVYVTMGGIAPLLNPVQLYLDFMLYGGRGQEQADFLVEHALGFRE